MVLAAGEEPEAEREAALGALCRSYWHPIFAYIRKRGHPAEAARDLTQEFFLQILGRRLFGRADRQQGRLRSFLMVSVQYFLADQADRARAVKRGGGVGDLPFVFDRGEEISVREPGHAETPERVFERRWAWAVVERVTAALREEYERQGRIAQFHLYSRYLMGRGDVPYGELAARAGMNEGALRTGVSRFRKRFRELLRAEVASTVARDEDVAAELRFLIAALQGREADDGAV